ncbi:TfoX/Sxy family protein [Sphaerotilus montanus]|uniref:TfoX/Sxy family transcriptional regulator of competence genes n=1 Tax=Sphaerotilus montanus TaxID=522889 RepID=A0A7Y9QZM5_9BURK|nr:TfoX/Sxy family protein [Sphaerotilus montanus]NYG32874.1 TfoX/Sxy family transcriptional regulator of competence genes [Sphaerotilus montanus]NZD57757.1 TfoX/Sxy family protein [Sphaerotilus montanus]
MSTDRTFIDHLADQLHGFGAFAHRKMFGEYALYLDAKVVALVCDNQLFVKPTDAGRALLGPDAAMGPPYPGAKPHFQVSDLIDEREALARLLRVTAEALPEPKPKKPTQPKTPTPAARRSRAPG